MDHGPQFALQDVINIVDIFPYTTMQRVHYMNCVSISGPNFLKVINRIWSIINSVRKLIESQIAGEKSMID